MIETVWDTWTVADKLNMSRVSACWVPHLLAEQQMFKRVEASQAFLQRYEKEGMRFFRRLMTGDEVRIWFCRPELKQKSIPFGRC